MAEQPMSDARFEALYAKLNKPREVDMGFSRLVAGEMIREIARLRTELDKLPKTADGVAVVPGMTLYSSQFLCGRFRSPETVVELVGYADPEKSEWAEGALDVKKLYSTEAAAREAMKEN